MTWSNLLSGLIGALLGGLFSIVAAVMTFRHERSQARQGESRTASGAILENIIAIRQAMRDIQWTMDPSNDSSDRSIDSSLETVRAAAQSTLYVYNRLIADETLRSRISELIDMVDVWYENARKSPTTVDQKSTESIESYIGRVIEQLHKNSGQLRLR